MPYHTKSAAFPHYSESTSETAGLRRRRGVGGVILLLNIPFNLDRYRPEEPHLERYITCLASPASL